MSLYFITAIDTNIGKTYTTGLLGRYFLEQQVKVITAKIAQTGCRGLSEDILLHRELMGLAPQEADLKGLTCPYVFSYPASPHLAAELEQRVIDPEVLRQNLALLKQEYDTVLMEGAGGIMVPLTREYTILDFIAEQQLEVLLVTSCRLGSINHTLCTLDVLEHRHVPVRGLIYNLFPPEKEEISKDTQNLLARRYPRLPLVQVPWFSRESIPRLDFSPFFS